MKVYTKDELIEALIDVSKRGWIPDAREGNHGGIGNTLEDLLDIEENNIPLPNAGEWELKCQRLKTTSLTTLTHKEPSPTAMKFVPKVFLPQYGWAHQKAGSDYPATEMSFRQTIHAQNYSDRGFTVQIDRNERKIKISFDSSKVGARHSEWLKSVEQRVGLGELDPQPYWGFDDLKAIVRAKLVNCVYAQAQVKKISGVTHYKYTKISMLSDFSFDGFLKGLELGFILVDFDARSGHNHGSKFRLRRNYFDQLYANERVIVTPEMLL